MQQRYRIVAVPVECQWAACLQISGNRVDAGLFEPFSDEQGILIHQGRGRRQYLLTALIQGAVDNAAAAGKRGDKTVLGAQLSQQRECRRDFRNRGGMDRDGAA